MIYAQGQYRLPVSVAADFLAVWALHSAHPSDFAAVRLLLVLQAGADKGFNKELPVDACFWLCLQAAQEEQTRGCDPTGTATQVTTSCPPHPRPGSPPSLHSVALFSSIYLQDSRNQSFDRGRYARMY